VALTGTGTSSTTNLALNQPVTASSYTQTYVPANAVDGNTSTYWEADNGVWPSSWITVNLGSAQTLGSVTITLPPPRHGTPAPRPCPSSAELDPEHPGRDRRPAGANQFGTQRYALLFEPGTYGSAADPLVFQVGYYTEVAGLGQNPSQVVINGSIDTFNQCSAPDPATHWTTSGGRSPTSPSTSPAAPAAGQHRVLGRVAGRADAPGPGQRQRVPDGLLRRLPDYASGGFIADSSFTGGTVDQRLAAAVHHPQQRPGRLDQRRLEPGVLRRPGRPGAELRRQLRRRGGPARTPPWPPAR
jgi:hypothetical protein